MINISLKQMFDEIVQCVLNKTEIPSYYYRRELFKGHVEFIEISEVDLMRGRFKTVDDDFSEYEWELEKSNIYKNAKG